MPVYNNLNVYERINYIWVNIQACLGILGITINMFAIFVFSRKKLKTYSYSVYWRVMAISDSIILLHTVRNWANFVFDFNLETQSPLMCKLSEYQPITAGIISTWLHFLISLDRLVIVVYPHRSNLFKKRSFQIVLILVVVVYSLLVNIELPLNYRLEMVNDSLVCYLPIEVKTRNDFSIMINFLSNVIFTNVMLVKLICFIRRSRKKARKGRFDTRRYSSSRLMSRDRTFAKRAIMFNLLSYLFKMPYIIGLSLIKGLDLNREQSQMVITITIAVGIIDCCDLFMFNMVVNSTFYKEFFRMMRFRKR